MDNWKIYIFSNLGSCAVIGSVFFENDISSYWVFSWLNFS